MLSFLLVGCWDRIEVNDLALVMATGIDKASDQKLQVTAQIATPSQGGQSATSSSNQLPYLVVSTVGDNTRSALQKMQIAAKQKIIKYKEKNRPEYEYDDYDFPSHGTY
jgi:spore germination protein KC